MEFELTDFDIEVMEKLSKICDLKENTREDIKSFLERYKFKKKFYEVVGKYIRIETIKLVIYLKVEEIEEDDERHLILRSSQTIRYNYTDDGVINNTSVTTIARGQNTIIATKVSSTNEYIIKVIDQNEYENELVNAVNIN